MASGDEGETKGEFKLGGSSGSKALESLYSPWGEPRTRSSDRVVGWRSGSQLTQEGVKSLIAHRPELKAQYKKLQADKKRKVREREAAAAPKKEDPLKNLPPTWQAIYGTVPHLDPRPAFEQWREDHRKKQAREKAEASGQAISRKRSLETEEDRAKLEEEGCELEEEVRRKKAALSEKERICQEWEAKLASARKKNQDDEERFHKLSKKLEDASYKYGILEGQMKSSDAFFTFVEVDTKADHAKKMATLSRSVALLGGQIDNLKKDVRGLLKEADEARRLKALEAQEEKAQLDNAPAAANEGLLEIGNEPGAGTDGATAAVPSVEPALESLVEEELFGEP